MNFIHTEDAMKLIHASQKKKLLYIGYYAVLLFEYIKFVKIQKLPPLYFHLFNSFSVERNFCGNIHNYWNTRHFYSFIFFIDKII